jgi:hypothetical protein
MDNFAPSHPARINYNEFIDIALPSNKLGLRQKALKRSKEDDSNEDLKAPDKI